MRQLNAAGVERSPSGAGVEFAESDKVQVALPAPSFPADYDSDADTYGRVHYYEVAVAAADLESSPETAGFATRAATRTATRITLNNVLRDLDVASTYVSGEDDDDDDEERGEISESEGGEDVEMKSNNSDTISAITDISTYADLADFESDDMTISVTNQQTDIAFYATGEDFSYTYGASSGYEPRSAEIGDSTNSVISETNCSSNLVPGRHIPDGQYLNDQHLPAVYLVGQHLPGQHLPGQRMSGHQLPGERPTGNGSRLSDRYVRVVADLGTYEPGTRDDPGTPKAADYVYAHEALNDYVSD